MGKERPPNKPAFFSTGSELTGPPQTKWPITSASAETSPHDIINRAMWTVNPVQEENLQAGLVD